MSNRFISGMRVPGMAVALISLVALPVTGQVTDTAPKSDLPRMSDGHPDLQGIYDLATMTPLERWPGDPPFLTKEQAEILQRAEPSAGRSRSARWPASAGSGPRSSRPNRSLKRCRERGGATGGYNAFWLNSGSTYNSWMDRSNIHHCRSRRMVMPLTMGGPQAPAARATPMSTAAERAARSKPWPAARRLRQPEQRPLSERCLLDSVLRQARRAADYFYNDLHGSFRRQTRS
jgi:hypothetical protein